MLALVCVLIATLTGAGSSYAAAWSRSARPSRVTFDPLAPEFYFAQAVAGHRVPLDAWRRRLLYVPRWLGEESGVIDSPTFYLAPFGKTDPLAELAATLRAMWQDPVTLATPDEHPLCRFPGRTQFLVEALGIPPDALPSVQCAAGDRWRRYWNVESVALVFAGYFPNNPASMFGHTLLKLNRRAGDGAPARPLLDGALNYAANSNTDNPFVYAIRGLDGGFPGVFSLLPYYVKIQEYNNAESRDLWEYPLHLTEREVIGLVNVLWEVGPHYADYFYLDENCATMMLLLLNAVRPTLELYDSAHLFATPADTLRSAARAPGLLGAPTWRASNRGRLMGRAKGLDRKERQALFVLISERSLTSASLAALKALTPAAQARVLDAALDWIDYDEALAGSRLAKKNNAFQRALLEERSQNQLPPEPIAPVDAAMAPHRGPGSQFLSVGVNKVESGAAAADFEWRPTLHRLDSPPIGYSPYLQVLLMALRVRWHEGKSVPHLERLVPFDALSLAPISPLHHALSWRFALNYERSTHMHRAFTSSAEGGVGATLASSNDRYGTYVLGLAQTGFDELGRPFAGPGVIAGAFGDPRKTLRMALNVHSRRDPGPNGGIYLVSTLSTTLLANDDWEFKAWIAKQSRGEVSAGLEAAWAALN